MLPKIYNYVCNVVKQVEGESSRVMPHYAQYILGLLKLIVFVSAFYMCSYLTGSCTVEPSEGQSLDTIFNITCSGWNSSDASPIIYEFQYTLQNSLHGILYKGNMSSFLTVLICGISTIKTVITDVNGTVIETEVNILVRVVCLLY